MEAHEDREQPRARRLQQSRTGGAETGGAIEGEFPRAFRAEVEALPKAAGLQRQRSPFAPVDMAARGEADGGAGRRRAQRIGRCFPQRPQQPGHGPVMHRAGHVGCMGAGDDRADIDGSRDLLAAGFGEKDAVAAVGTQAALLVIEDMGGGGDDVSSQRELAGAARVAATDQTGGGVLAFEGLGVEAPLAREILHVLARIGTEHDRL